MRVLSRKPGCKLRHISLDLWIRTSWICTRVNAKCTSRSVEQQLRWVTDRPIYEVNNVHFQIPHTCRIVISACIIEIDSV